MAKKTLNNTPNCGIGHMPDVMPMARGTTTKSKEEKKRQKDRKNKANGWND